MSDTCYLQLEVLNRNTLIENLTFSASGDVDFNTWSNTNVTKLIIEDQKMFYMPQNFTGLFSKITELKVLRTGLREISRTDIEGFHALEIFHVIRNDIESINEDLFQNHKGLSEIDFSDNKLKEIPDMFNKVRLPQLKIVNLNGNSCTKTKQHNKTDLDFIKIVVAGCNRFEAMGLKINELRKELDEVFYKALT